MTTDWRTTWDQGMADFCKQVDRQLELRFVPGPALDSMLHAADKGDKVARRLCRALGQWGDLAGKAFDAGSGPACAHCDVPLAPGDVAGFAFLMPASDAPGGVGMMAAYCERCIKLDRDMLSRTLRERLREDTGAVVVELQ